jgi:hypothetical protein
MGNKGTAVVNPQSRILRRAATPAPAPPADSVFLAVLAPILPLSMRIKWLELAIYGDSLTLVARMGISCHSVPWGVLSGSGAAVETKSPYKLQLSVSAQNVFNIVNWGPPVGTLGSPLFGRRRASRFNRKSSEKPMRKALCVFSLPPSGRCRVRATSERAGERRSKKKTMR